jgi:hypothetical protein
VSILPKSKTRKPQILIQSSRPRTQVRRDCDGRWRTLNPRWTMGSAGASIRRGSLRPCQTESRCTKTQLDVVASRTWKTSRLSQVLRVDMCSTCRASAWAVSCIGALPAAPTSESAATHSLSWSGRPLARRADGYSDWRRAAPPAPSSDAAIIAAAQATALLTSYAPEGYFPSNPPAIKRSTNPLRSRAAVPTNHSVQHPARRRSGTRTAKPRKKRRSTLR